MANPYINPGIIDPTNPEAVQIMRRQKMAEQLLGQSQEPLQGQMVSGHYVAPSWTQYLAKGLQAYTGQKGMQEADAAQQALAEKLRNQNQDELSKFTGLLQGKQAITLPEGEQGPVLPAQAPDLNAAVQFAAKSQNPMLQQFGLQSSLSNAQSQMQQQQQEQMRQKYAQMWNAAGGNPQKALALGMPAEMVKSFAEAPNLGKTKGVNVGDTLRDPYTGAVIGSAGNPNKPFNADGTPNPAFMDYEMKLKAAGRPQVNVNTKVENKAAENLAGKVGEILEKSAVAAQGAAQVSDAADRVISAVNSGKIIVGPLANQRLSMAQGAQLLGVGGKDDAETIANTRQAIRALSEMTLQGRKQMTGQGAITESESKLAEKANSGDISELTANELLQLAAASKRASAWTINNHNMKLKAAGQLPAGGELVPFYSNVEAPPVNTQPAANRPPLSSFKR